MTLTIDLTPAKEAQLRQIAAARGEDQTRFVANALRVGVAALVAETAGNEAALDPDAVAGIQEGLAQMDAGQGRPFAEFVAEVRAARRSS